MASDKDKGPASGLKVTDQSELPPIEKKDRTGGDSLSVKVKGQSFIKRFLYWFGALPAIGSFDWKVPTKDVDDGTNEYYKIIKTTSHRLWFPKDERQPKQWRGKCEKYKGLTVSGLTFPAYTETIIPRGESRDTNVVWPGAVKAMTEEQVEKILAQTLRWVIRANGDLVNLGIAERNGQEFDQYNPNTISVTSPIGSEFGDTPVAEYVYLVRLKAPWDTPKRDFHKLDPRMDMDEFFKNPPPALAQPVEKTSA